MLSVDCQLRAGDTVAGASSVQESLERLLASWLDDEWEARFLIDEALSILWSNQSAARWTAEDGCPFRSTDQRLEGKTARSQSQLSGLVSSALAGKADSLILETDTQDFLIRLKRVGHFGGKQSFGMSVRHLRQRGMHALVGLKEAFRLTGAEESVLHQMAQGQTVEGIAQRARISPETVRTHVRRVYSKMAVSSREEMFSRISPFMFVL